MEPEQIIVRHPDAAGWAEPWSPDAPDDALVIKLNAEAAAACCQRCGQRHAYMTAGCQPVLWTGRFRNQRCPGDQFSPLGTYMAPPKGLVGVLIREGNPGTTVAVVRSTQWYDEARDPAKGVDPYSWSAAWDFAQPTDDQIATNMEES